MASNLTIIWRIQDGIPEYQVDGTNWINLLNSPETEIYAQILKDTRISAANLNLVFEKIDELGILLPVLGSVEDMLYEELYKDYIKTWDDLIKHPYLTTVLQAKNIVKIICRSTYVLEKIFGYLNSKRAALRDRVFMDMATRTIPGLADEDSVMEFLSVGVLNMLTDPYSIIVPEDQDELIEIFHRIDRLNVNKITFFSQNKWIGLDENTTFFSRCFTSIESFARAYTMSPQGKAIIAGLTLESPLITTIRSNIISLRSVINNEDFCNLMLNNYTEEEVLIDPPPPEPEEGEDPLPTHKTVRTYYADVIFENADIINGILLDDNTLNSLIDFLPFKKVITRSQNLINWLRWEFERVGGNIVWNRFVTRQSRSINITSWPNGYTFVDGPAFVINLQSNNATQRAYLIEDYIDEIVNDSPTMSTNIANTLTPTQVFVSKIVCKYLNYSTASRSAVVDYITL